jgi:thiol:disulfide interchange protein
MQKMNLIKILVFVNLILVTSCSPKNSENLAKQESDSKNTEVSSKGSEVKKDHSSEPNGESEIVFAFDFKNDKVLSDVLDFAKSQNKPVFLDINAIWCAPCKLMQRDVYTHQETAQYFNDNFINYKVDVDQNEGPDLKLIYDITTIPTLLWLDSRGRVIYRKEGACYHKELMKNAEIALQKAKSNP